MALRQLTIISLMLLWAAAAQAGSMPDLDSIVAGLEQAQLANRNRLIPYTVTRDYRLLGGQEQKLSSYVVAEVSFLPPGNKSFTIRQASGSGRAEKVVRQILQREAQLAFDNSLAYSRQDYDFSWAGTQPLNGQPCHLLQIKAKRKEKGMLDGVLWVDAGNFRIRRFEGTLARSPSWWVKEVRLVLTYEEVSGMWLQTGADATAKVRVAGRQRLIARDVSYRTATSIAQKTARAPRASRRPSRPAPAMGAGMLVHP